MLHFPGQLKKLNLNSALLNIHFFEPKKLLYIRC